MTGCMGKVSNAAANCGNVWDAKCFRIFENLGHRVFQNYGECCEFHWKIRVEMQLNGSTDHPTFEHQMEVMSRRLWKFLACVREM